MTPEIALATVVILITICICCAVHRRAADRRHRLDQAYQYISQARRQGKYPADTFAYSPESNHLRVFLQGYLQVPDTIFGFRDRAGFTAHELSSLVTLWAELGGEANLCYGTIDERKRHPLHPSFGGYSSLWIEFDYGGEHWVYWNDASGFIIIDRRYDFYHNGAAVIHSDLLFRHADAYLFKS